MSEKVPNGWVQKRLEEFSAFRRGTTYVSTELSDDKERYPLYINMKSFCVGGGYNSSGDKYYSSQYLPHQIVKENDLLIANTDVTDSCDILGAPVYLPRLKLQNDVLFSHHVSALTISGDVDLKFLSLLLCTEHMRLEMKRSGRGTTVKMLDMRDVGKISANLPPLAEQKKIASILTSVDEVIENTQKQIDKLQDLKKAAMKELLTRGIGHTDFRDSELGRIPKSWKVKSIEQLVNSDRPVTYGIVQAGPHVESGVPYIRVSDMKSNRLLSKDMLRTSDEIASKFTRSRVQEGDIVYALRGDIGKVLIVPKNLEGANLTQGTALISKSDNIDTGFFIWCFNGEAVLKQTKDLAKGSTFAEMTLGNLKGLKTVLPPIEEQVEIAAILNSCEYSIDKKTVKLSQTKSLKKSLMQDLFTGKKRVEVK